MQDMIYISLVYNIQLGPATDHWAIYYISA